ncbi:hypothetical protein GWK08_12685 [Leptobacterium flavescens]|uniref:Outer membrane lipoprotein carrier protein LolA n=1 Tax=Leptobacterium flavescens TaxID=472055 RepID=A0A6P0ULT1_9FLAO|nr:hypothetical protein [Leptobacterium flavescens]NER14301.1 hypothetical protein [Leptobacterium flavescens]
MRNTLLCTVFLLVGAFCLNAQNPTGRFTPQAATAFTEDLRTIEQIKRVVGQAGSGIDRFNELGVTGTAYLYEDFKPGNIFFNDKDKGRFMLRYNIYAEEFETLEDDGSNSIVLKTSEVSLVMDGMKYIFKYYLNDDRKEFGYFQIVEELGRITLLRKYRKVVQEGKKAITSFDVTRPNRLVDLDNYFIMIDNNEIYLTKLTNSKLAAVFKELGVKLKPYLKDNKLNVKNQEDFLKALKYANDQLGEKQ